MIDSREWWWDIMGIFSMSHGQKLISIPIASVKQKHSINLYVYVYIYILFLNSKPVQHVIKFKNYSHMHPLCIYIFIIIRIRSHGCAQVMDVPFFPRFPTNESQWPSVNGLDARMLPKVMGFLWIFWRVFFPKSYGKLSSGSEGAIWS